MRIRSGTHQQPLRRRDDVTIIREGVYGDVNVDGLTVIAVVVFDGNAWAKESKVSLGIFIDERANDGQREALQKVFSGQAGGWMGNFAGKAKAFAVDIRPCPFRSWADRSRKYIPFDWTGPRFG